MEAGVYIVTGFLESGKTKFMQEMLTDDGFSEGERTLLLVCEEGEEEYNPEMLKKCNTVMVTLESEDDMAGDKLIELDAKYKPERVLIEYNSTWLLQALAARGYAQDSEILLVLGNGTDLQVIPIKKSKGEGR